MSGIQLKASGVFGSNDLEISVAEAEIIPQGKTFVNFNIVTDQDCHMSINGSDYIFFRAGQGLLLTPDDFLLRSVKIQEEGISYNWIGSIA